MARETIVKMIDDMDGSTEGVETYTFSLDGVDYSIDLGPANRQKLQGALAPFVAAAQMVRRTPDSRRTGSTGTRRNSRVDSRTAREWLKSNGYDLPDRGRIPFTMMEAYESRIPNAAIPALIDRADGQDGQDDAPEAPEKPAAAPAVPVPTFSAPEGPQPAMEPREAQKAAPVKSVDGPIVRDSEVKVVAPKKASPRNRATAKKSDPVKAEPVKEAPKTTAGGQFHIRPARKSATAPALKVVAPAE